MIKSLLSNRTLHKTLTLFGALILCVMSGACLTMKMYNAKKAQLHEQISGFLLNPTQQQIVFVGLQHHYIFPLSNDLRQILSWSGRGQIITNSLYFTQNKDNRIRGQYQLHIPRTTTLSANDQQALRSYGFVQQQNEFFYQGQFQQGTAYDAGRFTLPQMVTLDHPILLNINYDYASTGQVIGRVLMTPLTVAADGVSVVVGAVILLPILMVTGVGGR